VNWKRLLAYITGSVDQELLLRNEFLVTENRILKNQSKGRLQLTDLERISLAEIGKRLDRMALAEVAQIVRPETILGWRRKLIARKFNGSKQRTSVGRPATGQTIEDLVIQVAQENRSWGYRRIVDALSNLGHELDHQTVANVLKRHGLTPAPERGKKTLWKDFIRSHLDTLAEQQPENNLALAARPAEALRGVVEDCAGGAAVEAAARLVIEVLAYEFGCQGKTRRRGAKGLGATRWDRGENDTLAPFAVIGQPCAWGRAIAGGPQGHA
jgi:hypothetical protein